MSTKLNTLFDDKGRSLKAGSKLGSGGEGDVFSLEDAPNQVLKIYHKPPSPFQVNKLKAMLASSANDLSKFSTWPLSLACTPDHEVRGFTMPKIAPGYKEILQLYSPANRKKNFPKADYSFVVHAAMNIAAAFDAVHKAGHVVGDVNQKNLLVNGDALVTLIDCDSFQILAKEGTTFQCPVGVAEYTPPELQHTQFSKVLRTFDHDDFGMAVAIFHLLFMGRHPFAGKFIGDGDPPTIEKAIEQYLFPYAKDAAKYSYVPPPLSMPVNMFPDDILHLFEKSFGRGYEDKRPDADEWQAALKSFKDSLIRCSSDLQHKFFRSRKKCPWCEFEEHGTFYFRSKETSLTLIPSLVNADLVTQVKEIARDLQELIEPQTMLPRVIPNVISPELIESKACSKNASKIAVAMFVSLLITNSWHPFFFVPALCFMAWLALSLRAAEFHSEVIERKLTINDLSNKLKHLKGEPSLAEEKANLWKAEQFVREYVSLDSQMTDALKQAELQTDDSRLRQYLSQFSIEACPGVSERELSVLRTYFYLTADQLPVRGATAMLISSLADLTLREWKANLIEQYSGNNNIIALTASARNSLVTKYKHKAHDLEISLALQVPKLLELKDTCKTNAERLDGASNLKTKLARAKAELETLQNI